MSLYIEGGRGEGRGGEGSPPSHFGDIFFKHFCCAILDYVTTRKRRKDVLLAFII